MKEEKDKPPVAYFASVQGFNEQSVVAATSAGNARYQVFLALQDANYGYGFQHIRIRRAHNYDNIAPVLMARRNQCISMEFADDLAMQIPWDLRGDQVITARPAPAGTNEADDEAR